MQNTAINSIKILLTYVNIQTNVKSMYYLKTMVVYVKTFEKEWPNPSSEKKSGGKRYPSPLPKIQEKSLCFINNIMLKLFANENQ